MVDGKELEERSDLPLEEVGKGTVKFNKHGFLLKKLKITLM